MLRSALCGAYHVFLLTLNDGKRIEMWNVPQAMPVVQRGTDHAWESRSDKLTRMASSH
jgi:hypothetical protein